MSISALGIGPAPLPHVTGAERPGETAANKTLPAPASPASQDMIDKAPQAMVSKKSAVEEFLRWAEMSPAERIRAQFLESRGLSEDSLKAMPENEREAIEAEIEQRIRDLLGGEEKQPARTSTADTALQAGIAYTQTNALLR
ncbi:hypothetical protein [Maricaulis sp.]|uniref:hypothetical protein n=1 Tax=unclassified Maricaulis TaxID=2632371 RepID=UPI001B03D41A|nr:hypothetical protein [Maricaulis sp.]MBO6797313.1 hypothetical protein [Maricaulis sp.]